MCATDLYGYTNYITVYSLYAPRVTRYSRTSAAGFSLLETLRVTMIFDIAYMISFDAFGFARKLPRQTLKDLL